MTEFSPRKQLRVTAQPVDTFARAPREAAPSAPSRTNRMLELANVLQNIEPRLNRFLTERVEEQRAEDEALGLQMFATGQIEGIETNRRSMREMIDQARASGDDALADRLMSLSPHFKRGYMRARADTAGMGLADVLRREYQTNPEITLPNGEVIRLQQSDDPAHFQMWQAEATRKYLSQVNVDGMDPIIFRETFLPRMAQAQGISQREHTETRIRRRQEEYFSAMDQNIAVAMDQALSSGDFETAVAAIQGRLDSAVADGIAPRAANERVVETITAAAFDRRDTRILNILDRLDTGNGPLGNIGWVRQARERAEDRIEARSFRDAQRADRARERSRRDRLRDIERAAGELFAAEGYDADFTEIEALMIAEGEFGQVAQLRSSVAQMRGLENRVEPNHDMLATIRQRISDAATDEDFDSISRDILRGTGQFWDGSTAMDLYRQFDIVRGSGGALRGDTIRGIANDLRRQIDDRFRGDPVTEEGANDQIGPEAQSFFYAELTEWYERESADGTPPGRGEVRLQAEELFRQFLSSPRYAPDANRDAPANAGLRPSEAERLGIDVLRGSASPEEAQTNRNRELVHSLGTDQLLGVDPTLIGAERGALSTAQLADLFTEHSASPDDQTVLAQLAARHGMGAEDYWRTLMGTDGLFQHERDALAREQGQVPPTATETGNLLDPISPQFLEFAGALLDDDFLDRNLGANPSKWASDDQLGAVHRYLGHEKNWMGVYPGVSRAHYTDTAVRMVRDYAREAGIPEVFLEPGESTIDLETDPIIRSYASALGLSGASVEMNEYEKALLLVRLLSGEVPIVTIETPEE